MNLHEYPTTPATLHSEQRHGIGFVGIEIQDLWWISPWDFHRSLVSFIGMFMAFSRDVHAMLLDIPRI